MKIRNSKHQKNLDSHGYFSLLTKKRIIGLIDQILVRMETESLAYPSSEKSEYFRLPFLYRDGQINDEISYNAVFNILNSSSLFINKFKFIPLGVQKLDSSLHWGNACELLRIYKKHLIVSKSASSDEIAKLTVINPNDGEKKYRIVINDEYNEPIEVDSTNPSWELLLKIAKERDVFDWPNPKKSLDYFNSNKQCRLYTRTGYSITKILKIDRSVIKAALSIELISERQYKQRLNQIKSSKNT